MPNVPIDENWMEWALRGSVALVLFLLSLGIKDIRDRIKYAEQLCAKTETLEALIDRNTKRLDRLEQDLYERRKD